MTDGPLVPVIVEYAEVPAAIVGDLGNGDGRRCLGAGLHGQRQAQVEPTCILTLLTVVNRVSGSTLWNFALLAVLNLRILIAAVAIAFNGHRRFRLPVL